MFFETFDKFKGRGFHLSGESYGVRGFPLTTPAFSSAPLAGTVSSYFWGRSVRPESYACSKGAYPGEPEIGLDRSVPYVFILTAYHLLKLRPKETVPPTSLSKHS